jgi:hypothetical protein
MYRCEFVINGFDMKDIEKAHKEVWRAFTDQDPKNRRFVFRIDGNCVVALSETFPIETDRLVIRECKVVDFSGFDEDQVVSFAGRINPVKCETKTNKMIQFKTEEGIYDWLLDKLSGDDFFPCVGIPEFRFLEMGVLKAGKKSIFWADVEGKIVVLRKGKFVEHFRKNAPCGFGREGSYGFGLIDLWGE